MDGLGQQGILNLLLNSEVFECLEDREDLGHELKVGVLFDSFDEGALKFN